MRWAVVALLSSLIALGAGWWPGPGRSDGVRLAYIYRGDLWVAADGARSLQITHGAGAASPRWSPDGRWLTYFTGRELWLASTDGRHLRRLVDERNDGGVEQAAWSPVAPTLAYINRGSLWVVDVGKSGVGRPRELHLPAASFAWAPDGQRLAVEEPDGGPWPAERVVGPGDETPQAGVVIVEFPSGSFRDLFRIPWLKSAEGQRRPAWPLRNLAWSPDGQWITFHQLALSGSLSADMTTLMAVSARGGQLQPVGKMLAYADWVGWKPGEPVLTFVAGVGRDTWLGKGLTLALPPDFDRQGQRVTTPKGQNDQGFAWAPRCGRSQAAPKLAVVRNGPESQKDPFGRPLPAIFVDEKQASRPAAPFGDYAPHFDCQGRLAWVRISHQQATVMRENEPWVQVDVPDWYYGHWSTDELLAFWEPARSPVVEPARSPVVEPARSPVVEPAD